MADNVTANPGSGGPVFATDEATGNVHYPVSIPYCKYSDVLVGNASSTSTSNTSVIAAQGSGISTYITTLIGTNTSTTDVLISIKADTTTIVNFFIYAGTSTHLNFPVPFFVGTNVTTNFASGTAASTIYVTAIGFKWTNA